MAVVNTKATAVTNADAATQTLNKKSTQGGIVKSFAGTVEAANGDSSGSTYRMFRVKSSMRPRDLTLQCDALGGSAAADVGLYDTAANGGAAVDADFFASAVSLVSALQGTNVLREAAAAGGDVANIEKAIWEVLGLSADPRKEYDVVVSLTAASAAAATISLEGGFVDGN